MEYLHQKGTATAKAVAVPFCDHNSKQKCLVRASAAGEVLTGALERGVSVSALLNDLQC